MSKWIINTENLEPPIFIKVNPWIATLEGYEPGQAIGNGETELDAVVDLMEQVIQWGPK
jgi:hypothetical protein